MAQQIGAAAPPAHRLVEATTICFSEEAAPAGKFVVSVACFATRCFEFWRPGGERPQDKKKQRYAAGSTTTTLAVEDLASLQSAHACRATLRGMLARFPQLRSLLLTEAEWDAVVPGDLVPEIVGAARRGNGFIFCFTVKVHRRVIVDEPALLMACKESLATPVPGEKKDCAICLDELESESAVELTHCQHVFHRRCISKWFSTGSRCPTCRDYVWLTGLPEFLPPSSTGEPAQGTTAVPDIQ